MKNILVSALVLFTIFLSGCTGRQLTPETVYSPLLDKVSVAEIGQNMFQKIYALYDDKEEVKILDKETELKYKKMYNKLRFKKLDDNSCAMVAGTITRFFDNNCDGIFTHYTKVSAFATSIEKLNKPIKYITILAEPTYITSDSFKYVVLYQGKVGNKLKISFQEFTSGHSGFIIRDAFTQNIEYELNPDGEAMVGFRGLRIKVLKATNFDITYKVIKDYD